MMSFVLFVTQYIASGYGVALIALAVVCCFIAAALQFMPPRSGFIAMGCGAAAWLGSYLVKTGMTAF